jgi:hypothetical protein
MTRRPGSNVLRGRAFGVVVLACACGPSAGGAVGESTTSSSSSSSTGGDADPSVATSVDPDATGEEVTTALGSTSSSSSSDSGEDSTTGYVSHCEVPPELPPACWDGICNQFFCGCAACLYDAEGCPRQACATAEDCADGAYCNANILVSPCIGGGAGGWTCEAFVDRCVCGGSLGCGPSPHAFCLDATEFSESDICLASEQSCATLLGFVAETHGGIVEVAESMAPDVLAYAQDCQWARMQRLFDECGESPCDVLCDQLPGYSGCFLATDCSECADADPAEVLALIHALVDRPLGCADCALCDELQSDLCAAITGC